MMRARKQNTKHSKKAKIFILKMVSAGAYFEERVGRTERQISQLFNRITKLEALKKIKKNHALSVFVRELSRMRVR